MPPDRDTEPTADPEASPKLGAPPWGRRGIHVNEPPPWWPADLAWPPDERAWAQNRRRMMRKFAIAVAVFVFFIATVVAIVTMTLLGKWDHTGPLRGLMLLFFLGTTFAIIRVSRRARSYLVFADIMNAADRVATGDYSVRVSEHNTGGSHQLAVSFNTMVARLAENDAQRRALLADIAHELRTPLSVVRGTIEAMLDGVYPADQAHLSPMLDEIAVITRLLEDLQLVATAEAGGLKLYRETIDLGELDDDLIAAFGPRAAEAGIDLRPEIPAGLIVSVDPVRIRQVLENLVSNAIRYTPAGGSVVVSGVRTPDGIEASVVDTGAGMTDEQRSRMFDRFVKSADSGGSGLGLSIAKSLVEAHGGKIWATATDGGGTTVSFSLGGSAIP